MPLSASLLPRLYSSQWEGEKGRVYSLRQDLELHIPVLLTTRWLDHTVTPSYKGSWEIQSGRAVTCPVKTQGFYY